MSKRSQFDDVANSLRNGQRKQAYNQMLIVGMDDMPEMLEYFASDLADCALAIDAAKTFFKQHYP